MNTADRVIQYIDDVYRHSFDRPRMQFTSPESFEEVVIYFEQLRDFLLDLECQSSNFRFTYSDYLVSKGFGAGRFTSKYMESHPDSECRVDDLFKAYSEFLIEYIDCGRKASDRRIEENDNM